MRSIWKAIGSLLVTAAISSCAGGDGPHEIVDYSKAELDYVQDYRILQLTDIHFGLATKFAEEWDYFDKVIASADSDMIVLTGDMFMNASADTVEKLYSYIDGKDIPWTIAFGNHDRQGFYTPQYIEGQSTIR